MEGFKEFFEKYKKPIIFGGIGLLIGILMLTIGFFATLLLALLTVLELKQKKVTQSKLMAKTKAEMSFP